MAKVSCILPHQDVQLILTYIWVKTAILVAGRVEGGIFSFLCIFTFIPESLSSLSLSLISTSISFLPFFGRQHKMTHKRCYRDMIIVDVVKPEKWLL